MTGFIILAALLLIAIVALLVTPLWRSPRVAHRTDQRETNLAIFRDQLAEIEREKHAGTLAEADFEQARQELQRRLLQELPATEEAPAHAPGERKTALALLIVLPLAATLLYALLGNRQALDPVQRQARMAPEQIATMVAGLAEKLRESPDDSKGWIMLARSYKVLERFSDAAEAYSHVGALLERDAGMLADYAEVLSLAKGGDLQGKPSEMIERALKIDPNEPQALLLAGAAARDRRQFSAAADYWARLLAQLEPGTAEADALENAISQARSLVSQPGKATGDAKSALSGEVTLSSKLAGQARPDDVLFVFARAENGSRIPLAAIRARVADLPLRFRLDDSMALSGGGKLSEFATVRVEARIAKAGQAQSSSGDLFGALSGVKPGSDKLRLVIDKVQP
ncbi:MAG TPA: c-type cytochrome biogenesis protein CcmI [Accumulibacter sp.]|jgi:cytochrome c-type biogenesis protein CcmH|nr:c-type cytochrome biogenesis protein CcmI [Accumulibacter sp.]HQC80366.1 c-type cytochrome biogenesis protein CcmI [Accumulibacter sp.]